MTFWPDAAMALNSVMLNPTAAVIAGDELRPDGAGIGGKAAHRGCLCGCQATGDQDRTEKPRIREAVAEHINAAESSGLRGGSADCKRGCNECGNKTLFD